MHAARLGKWMFVMDGTLDPTWCLWGYGTVEKYIEPHPRREDIDMESSQDPGVAFCSALSDAAATFTNRYHYTS
ncbi:hypothetical protein I204_08555 [Kwoniella mangroviensis CBS 8886]|nr:hypothetical protein I204_08555 [Kwoniella mangroviensis CBS 8886]